MSSITDALLSRSPPTPYTVLKSTTLLSSHPLSVKPLLQTSTTLLNASPLPNLSPLLPHTSQSLLIDLLETRITNKSQNIKIKNLKRTASLELSIIKNSWNSEFNDLVYDFKRVIDSTILKSKSEIADTGNVEKRTRKKFKKDSQIIVNKLKDFGGDDLGVNKQAFEGLGIKVEEISGKILYTLSCNRVDWSSENGLDKLSR
ncbi:hypothetical protein TL16_g01579 [Triparma laevis f. inornata]|uniref:Uncharacterized protein n=2 Tax=Triparma laevis TaxID=1534972 RepID=A0A9W7C4N2_9STRA|nr:hypothetical protein TL16_g01579 [Triparma laevis f. inornata]GMH99114.1 hypothetical protein TrLO_g6879 [Triparma laevis f. longispina]